MLKDAGDVQARACLSILSINRLALQAWRPAPSLPVTNIILIEYILQNIYLININIISEYERPSSDFSDNLFYFRPNYVLFLSPNYFLFLSSNTLLNIRPKYFDLVLI
jgi:hypothetical protein